MKYLCIVPEPIHPFMMISRSLVSMRRRQTILLKLFDRRCLTISWLDRDRFLSLVKHVADISVENRCLSQLVLEQFLSLPSFWLLPSRRGVGDLLWAGSGDPRRTHWGDC